MTLKIATEFSTAPGPRRISEGKFSGEQFRKVILLPRLLESIKLREPLTVILDGTSGYGTSFLEEAFGGLIRENDFSYINLKQMLQLVSKEEPDLLLEIDEYMTDAEEEKPPA